MSEYVANGDYCYYCKYFYSAEHITDLLFTDGVHPVCKDCNPDV